MCMHERFISISDIYQKSLLLAPCIRKHVLVRHLVASLENLQTNRMTSLSQRKVPAAGLCLSRLAKHLRTFNQAPMLLIFLGSQFLATESNGGDCLVGWLLLGDS